MNHPIQGVSFIHCVLTLLIKLPWLNSTAQSLESAKHEIRLHQEINGTLFTATGKLERKGNFPPYP